MFLRAMLDIGFSLFVVAWFQIGLINYASLLMEAKKLSKDILCSTQGADSHGDSGGHDSGHRMLAGNVLSATDCEGIHALT